MKLLLTGGLGLIGHTVARKAEQDDHDVIITDTKTTYGLIPQEEITYLMGERLLHIRKAAVHGVDIVDRDGMDYLMQRYRPDVVVHLASFPRQKVVNRDPMLGSRAMSEGLLNLLELSVKYHVRRFVYISSSMVYGDFGDGITEDAPCDPQGQYGILKLAGEWLVKDYFKRQGLEFTIIRPSAVYGPLDVEDRVVSKFLLTAMRGGTINVNGASERLDFTYVDDAADGILAAATTAAAANKTYNITKSCSYTLLAAAELAVRLVGKGKINIKDRDRDFPSRGALNIDAARKDLGFDPKVDVEEGFERYYKWLCDSCYWQKRLLA